MVRLRWFQVQNWLLMSWQTIAHFESWKLDQYWWRYSITTYQVVGRLVGPVSVIYEFLCMSIIPILPALFANRFLADRASQSRCPAPLYFLLSLQFSSYLFSVTHPTVSSRLESEIYPLACTFSGCYPRYALVLNSNPCFLWLPVCNPGCQFFHTKETPSTVTGN